MHELHRIKREIEANGLDMNKWYKDMTENDQDSCGKKLICELRSKQTAGVITVRIKIEFLLFLMLTMIYYIQLVNVILAIYLGKTLL